VGGGNEWWRVATDNARKPRIRKAQHLGGVNWWCTNDDKFQMQPRERAANPAIGNGAHVSHARTLRATHEAL